MKHVELIKPEEVLRRLMQRDGEIQYARFLTKAAQEDLHKGTWHYPELSGVRELPFYDARATCYPHDLIEEFEYWLEGENGVALLMARKNRRGEPAASCRDGDQNRGTIA